ncbi:hypothetical protein ACQEU5_24965 [Marinactinospora thermotolerans]|uniref:hypothetical protein n=1 Tax=Marinactinospora thermotolerans TaxID=531310 RepID=UPI003D938563
MTTSAQARSRRIQAVEELAAAVGCATDVTGLTDLLKRVLDRANDYNVAEEAWGRHLLLQLAKAPTSESEQMFACLVNEARSPQLASQRQAWLNGHPWGEGHDPLVAAAESVTDLMCALTAHGVDAEHILNQLTHN